MMHLEADVFRKFDKQWALVTAGTPEHYNTMTISWGGHPVETAGGHRVCEKESLYL